jgi:hypothetical protein
VWQLERGSHVVHLTVTMDPDLVEPRVKGLCAPLGRPLAGRLLRAVEDVTQAQHAAGRPRESRKGGLQLATEATGMTVHDQQVRGKGGQGGQDYLRPH